MIDLNLIKYSILFIGCLYSAIIDHKTGEIPDYITYSMIIFGWIINIFQGNILMIEFSIIVFIFMCFLYNFLELGGGDVKLFTGISVLSSSIQFFLITYFISCLITIPSILWFNVIQKKKFEEIKLRFAPFIFIGFLISSIIFNLLLN